MGRKTRDSTSAERRYIAGRTLIVAAFVAYVLARSLLEIRSAAAAGLTALVGLMLGNLIRHQFSDRFRAGRVRSAAAIEGRLDDRSGDGVVIGYGIVCAVAGFELLSAGALSAGADRLLLCSAGAAALVVSAAIRGLARRRRFLIVDRDCLTIARGRDVMTIPWRGVETLRGGRVDGRQQVLIGLISVDVLGVEPARRRPAAMRMLRRNRERFESCLALDPDRYGLDRQATLDAFIAFARATDRYAMPVVPWTGGAGGGDTGCASSDGAASPARHDPIGARPLPAIVPPGDPSSPSSPVRW